MSFKDHDLVSDFAFEGILYEKRPIYDPAGKVIEGLRNPRLRARGGLFLVEGIRGAAEFLHATLPVKVRFALISPGLQATAAGGRLRGELAGAPFPVEEVDGVDKVTIEPIPRKEGK